MATFGTTSDIGWDLCSNVTSDCCNVWINSDTSDCTAGRLLSASDYVLNTDVGTWRTSSNNGDLFTVGETSTSVRIDPWEDDDIGEEEERGMCTYREAGHRRSLRFWRDRYNLKYR